MPFCPKCKYEYKRGVRVCPDCGLKLVPKLHQQPTEELVDEDLVCVATFPFEIPAQEAKLKLASRGIRSVIWNEKVAQTDIILAWADGGVKLMVLEHDAAEARSVLEHE
jgi:methionyl-tRNA synthetase